MCRDWQLKKYIKILNVISAFAVQVILIFFFVLFGTLVVECRLEPDYLDLDSSLHHIVAV